MVEDLNFRLGGDRFLIERQLGVGGMGVVYLALDRTLQQRIALKRLRRLDPGEAFYLKREFRSLADVEHPNLIRLHELFADIDECFFTMEYVDGCGFLQFVRQNAGSSLPPTTRDRPLVEGDTARLTTPP